MTLSRQVECGLGGLSEALRLTMASGVTDMRAERARLASHGDCEIFARTAPLPLYLILAAA
jgi:hypothetical protein